MGRRRAKTKGGDVCPRCLSLAFSDLIRPETVMPLPPVPPLAIEHLPERGSPAGSPICHDCQSAENLAKVGLLAAWVAPEPGGIKRPMPQGLDFTARRIVVGNERQEQLRLPEGMRPFFGLVAAGLVKPSKGTNALDDHHRWLASVGIRMGARDPLAMEDCDG